MNPNPCIVILPCEIEYIGQGPHTLMTVVQEGQLVASAKLCFRERKVAEVSNFFVILSHRRLRIGSKIMQACIKLAEAEGCESIILEVNCYNRSAIAFYRSLGFFLVYDYKEENGNWMMAKKLI